jgi:hypothetical protein
LTGYQTDGYGNCIEDYVISSCAYGFIKDSDRECVLPPPPCGVGYESIGNGNCIPIQVKTECADGYESDGNGVCLLIPRSTDGPVTTSVYNTQKKEFTNSN